MRGSKIVPQKRHLAAAAMIISPHSGHGRRDSPAPAGRRGLRTSCAEIVEKIARCAGGAAPLASVSGRRVADQLRLQHRRGHDHDLPALRALRPLAGGRVGAASSLPQDGQFMLIGMILSFFRESSWWVYYDLRFRTVYTITRFSRRSPPSGGCAGLRPPTLRFTCANDLMTKQSKRSARHSLRSRSPRVRFLPKRAPFPLLPGVDPNT